MSDDLMPNEARLAWCIARACAGVPDAQAEIELETFPEPWRTAAGAAIEGGTKRFFDVCGQLEQGQRLIRLVLQTDPRAKEPPAEAVDGWRVYTLAEAYKPRPPLEYVVSGLFPLPSLNIVYGSPGTFKSLLMCDLCVCVAAGRPWLPPLPGKDDVIPLSTTAGPVWWLDFDNGKRRTDERLEALARACDLTPAETPFYYVSMPVPWLDASNYLAMEELGNKIEVLGARLVVIDNLGVIIGKADENSTDMASIMGNLRRLSEDAGAAVVLLHHQRKATGFKGRAGETLRGHSSIEAALDLALLVSREEHADRVEVKSTKVRGADVYPFGAVFAYDHRPGTDELGKARFYGVPVEDLISERAIRRLILEIVAEHPGINQSDLIEKVKASLPDVGTNRVRDGANYLVSIGDLIFTRTQHNAYSYKIPEHDQGELDL